MPRGPNVRGVICSLLVIVATGFVVRALSVTCGENGHQFGWSDIWGAWLFWSVFFGIVIGIITGYARLGLRDGPAGAGKAPAPAQAQGQSDGLKWSWPKVLVVWTAIGAGVLFGGGVAARGYLIVRGQMTAASLFDSCGFWLPLLLFSLGGGLTIGLLILTWWLVAKIGFSWTLGFAVLGVVLFAVFVWPTPYQYTSIREETIKGGTTETTRVVLRINRLTGQAVTIYPKESKQP